VAEHSTTEMPPESDPESTHVEKPNNPEPTPVSSKLWAKSAGGTSADSAYSIATDASGNAYIAGSLGAAGGRFGSRNRLTSKGDKDLFIAKLSSEGTWLWAKSVGTTGREVGVTVKVDSNGSPWVIGEFQGTLVLSSKISLQGNAQKTHFLARLNPQGQWEWAKSLGSSNIIALDVAFDNSGYAYITGSMTGTASFGKFTVTSAGGTDAFLAKLKLSDGTWEWVVKGGCANQRSQDKGQKIIVNKGTIFFAGRFGSCDTGEKVTFGNLQASANSLSDLFVASLDASGKWQWVLTPGSTGQDASMDLAVGKNGQLYLAGFFEKSILFGSHKITSRGRLDIFVAKIDPKGKWLWATAAGSPGHDIGVGIAVDRQDRVFVAGQFSGSTKFGGSALATNNTDIFVAQVDANTGGWLWARKAGGSGYDTVSQFALDAKSHLLLTGNFKSPASFGNTNLTPSTANDTDLFVWKTHSSATP